MRAALIAGRSGLPVRPLGLIGPEIGAAALADWLLWDHSTMRRANCSAERKRSLTILSTEAGTACTESGFRASWRKGCLNAGVEGVTFHDLRGTVVTRLA